MDENLTEIQTPATAIDAQNVAANEPAPDTPVADVETAAPASEIAEVVVETPPTPAPTPKIKTVEIVNDVDDYESMVSQSMEGLRLSFRTGAPVKGIVSGIDDRNVFVNVHSTKEGIIDRKEFLNDEGEMTVKIGDEIEAMVVSTRNDTLMLSAKMDGILAARHLGDAFKAGLPVEGVFKEERKGGYSVDIGGVTAFCPFSQADLRPLPTGTSLAGVKAVFIITKLEEEADGPGDLVVSRRRVLEAERNVKRDALKLSLKVGDKVTGEVTRVMEFGVFVELGGSEGLVPANELSWSGRRINPIDVLHVGDRAEVIVKEIDWDRERISLSFRGAKQSWESIVETYHEGKILRGNVLRMEPFGAFVEIGNDIEGLLHINEISNYFRKRVKQPEDVYKLGDEITVCVNKIDNERHRISLTLPPDGTHMTWDEVAQEFQPGTLCEGVVSRIESFGVFVELEDELEGLLHISKIGSALRRHIKSPDEVFKVGEDVVVEIESVDAERHRISLRLPPREVMPEETTPLEVGQSYEGTVKFLKPFGVIVDLGNRNTGLLHQSQTGDKIIHKVGDKVTVIVESIGDNDKISLAIPESLEAKAQEAEMNEWFATQKNKEKTEGMGSFADAFNGLDLKL